MHEKSIDSLSLSLFHLPFSELSKLKEEIEILTQDLSTSESLYHRLSAQIEILEVTERRVNDDLQFRKNIGLSYSEEHRTFQDMLVAHVQKLETESKELREKKRVLEESQDTNLKQIQMFNDLKRLLEEKMHLLRNQASDRTLHADHFSGVNTSDMTHMGLGVDRLVIGDM